MSKDQEVLEKDENTPVEETAEEIQEETPETNEPEAPEEEAPEADEKPVEREVWTMPVAKAQKEKERAIEKARQEALEEAQAEKQRLIDEYEAKLASNKSTVGVEDKISKWAEEQGYDVDAAKSLIDIVRESIPVPDTSKYDQLLESQRIEAERAKVRTEFDERVAPLILKENPQATAEHIRKVQERIEELAFTEGYNTYRLEDIYKVKADEFKFKHGFSAEPSGGRNSELVDFESMTDEEEHELAKNDPAKYREYVDYMRGKHSLYTD